MYKHIPVFHVANTVSLIGLFFSLWSIRSLFEGNTDFAIILFVLSGLCDLFDGKFARLFKRDAFQQQMGEYIHSFVDMISFVALPVIFSFHFVSGLALPLVLAVFYAICGIHRLGYFHIIKEDDFISVPLTYITLAFTQAKGIIAEKGSLLSHTAIISRELGIPAVVGIKQATTHLKTGDRVILDGNSGKVTRKEARNES